MRGLNAMMRVVRINPGGVGAVADSANKSEFMRMRLRVSSDYRALEWEEIKIMHAGHSKEASEWEDGGGKVFV